MKPVRLPPEARRQIEEFEALKTDIASSVAKLRDELAAICLEAEAERSSRQPTLDVMIADKVAAAGLVAAAWADYETGIAEARAEILEAKSRPAHAAAEEVRERGRKLAALRRESKYARWLLELYEWHFPWLADLRDDGSLGELIEGDTDASGDEEADPVTVWVTKAEVSRLSTVERNQLALDRYLRGRQSPWQIGRDYEQYRLSSHVPRHAGGA
jgi:hypothetical protein